MKAALSTLCRFAAPVALGACTLAMAGCDDSVGGESGEGGGNGSGGGGDTIVPPQSIDALDLLIVVDGSGSMADKQGFLAASIRPFLDRIRNPRCVDASHAPIASQPAQGSACPADSVREYTADVTVHLGIISSSLGSVGTEVCSPRDGRNNDDAAHLVWRSTPGTDVNDLPSYQGQGFFAFDPAARLSPAGDADFDSFVAGAEQAIVGVGEVGCGFEMPLEAMYRFLNDPAPSSMEAGDVDQVVLDQRAAFLRDESVLQVVLLSDENDASTRADGVGSYFLSLSSGVGMPRPRAECATDPSDACCVPCIDAAPEGCPGDGGCAEPGNEQNPANFFPSDSGDNEINLRTWQPKRRFGLDVLYPVERYILGLSSMNLLDGQENPVFGNAVGARTVLFTAVVGVPWQDVARRNQQGQPDATLGFQSGAELASGGTWDVILGNPDANVPPTDPLMIESPEARPGLSTTYGSSPVNGNEFDTDYKDLQYTCVFALPVEDQRVCSDETSTAGDCAECNALGLGKPICSQDDPLVQIKAKAYPGLRQLQVAKGLGNNALVVPICGLDALPAEPPPGPVGTFIMSAGLTQAAEQTATALGGVSQ